MNMKMIDRYILIYLNIRIFDSAALYETWVKLLGEELLISYPIPLCDDAFSRYSNFHEIYWI